MRTYPSQKTVLNDDTVVSHVSAPVALKHDGSGRWYMTFKISALATLPDGQVVEMNRELTGRSTRQSRKRRGHNHAHN